MSMGKRGSTAYAGDNMHALPLIHVVNVLHDLINHPGYIGPGQHKRTVTDQRESHLRDGHMGGI